MLSLAKPPETAPLSGKALTCEDMAKTAEKIEATALELFNEKGVVNVRLQHIADACGISVGNLAYHFYSKEALVLSLVKRIWEEQKILLANYRAAPLFEHLDYILENKFRLQKTFSFFYLDTLELFRVFPKTRAYSQEQIHFQVLQFEGMFLFNAARGAFIQGRNYKQLARRFWQECDLWLYGRHLRGEEDLSCEAFKSDLWALLMPCFTPMGHEEYLQQQQQHAGAL